MNRLDGILEKVYGSTTLAVKYLQNVLAILVFLYSHLIVIRDMDGIQPLFVKYLQVYLIISFTDLFNVIVY